MSENKIAVYCATRNLYEDMLPAAKSLSIHSDVDKIYFVIEDDDFPYPLPPWVETINVSNQGWIKPSSPNWNCGWTWMVMMRACFTKIFPHVSRIVSLDCDTICLRDVSALWTMPLDGCYMGMAIEPSRCAGGIYYQDRFGKSYHNAGVCIQDLDALRARGFDDQIIRALNTNEYSATEQDAFNLVLRGAIKEIPPEYNDSDWTAHVAQPRIVHYAGIKAWQHLSLVEDYRAIPWEKIRCGL